MLRTSYRPKSCKPQITTLCKNFKTKLKKLYHIRFLNQNYLYEIYFKGILPSILYCIAIWGGCTKTQIDKINTIHIKAARFIKRIKKSIPDTQVLEKANWHSILWYHKRRIACITHKLYYESDPNNNLIKKRNTTRQLRNNLQIQKHSFKSTKFKNSFT